MTANTPEISVHCHKFFESLPPGFGSVADVAALLARKQEESATLRKRPQEPNRTAKLKKLDEEIPFLITLHQTMVEYGNISLRELIAQHHICNCIWEKPGEVVMALHFCKEIRHHLRHHAAEAPSPAASQPRGRLRRWLENAARSMPALPGLPRAVRT